MNVTINERHKELVETLVREGRFGSAEDAVREALGLLEEQESKLKALRDHLNAAIERGGSFTSEEVMASVRQRLDQLKDEKRRA